MIFVSLFYRFDLIFLMLDPEDEIFDRKLANHLVSLYYKSSEHEQQELLVNILLLSILCYVEELRRVTASYFFCSADARACIRL
jgi:DNA replicative helicase MCM subunit Mcm2 (Cdc46/Mcm family)